MAIADDRSKVLFLPVIRGTYDAALTVAVKAAMRAAAAEVGAEGLFPADDDYTGGLICSDDDVRGYFEAWRGELSRIGAMIAFSSDFMAERAVQDTARLLPPDVPVFLIVNNDDPTDMAAAKVGDALCGSLSVHHNLRMLGRSIVRSCRIDMHDAETLRDFLGRYLRIAAGIERLRNLRIAMIGVNPSDFATTFTNQLKLFELGFSLHPYELLDLWGDTVLGGQLDEGLDADAGPGGGVKLRWPIYRNDPRVADVKAQLCEAVAPPPDERHQETIARCFLWIQDLFERDRLDAGAIHCWSEFPRYFGLAPCAVAMLANLLLRRPVVCELDICHAAVAALAWPMTDQAGVILDINNNGWDPRVFNVFHCSQTPPNWLARPGCISDWGGIEGPMAPEPFTGVSAATTPDAFRAIVFHGQFLRDDAGSRGSSGWAFVPNLPDVLRAVETAGIHHFVAMKGHLGRDVADVLRFRGLVVTDMTRDVPGLDALEAELPRLADASPQCRRVFSQ